MGRDRLSGSSRRNHQRGLKVELRGETFHLTGTLRVGKQSQRIRESTGINRSTPRAREMAEARRIRREAEILEALVHGRKPPVPFATVAGSYIDAQKPGYADMRNVRELIVTFGSRNIHDVDQDKIEEFYRRRFPRQDATTIRRHMTSLRSVLGYAVKMRALDFVPYWERPKVLKRKGRSMAKQFLSGEAELLIDCAAPHAQPIMVVELVTGARTGQVIHLLKENFVLIPDRGRVLFPETKNGNAYSRPLHNYAVEILQAWLKTRKDKYPEMFLTDKDLPYVVREGYGGHIKKAFSAAKDRCVSKLGIDRARVISQATPHWFRHNLANKLRQEKGWDKKMIAEAGMWENEQVVGDHYLGDESDVIEEGLRSLEFGKKLTQGSEILEQMIEKA